MNSAYAYIAPDRRLAMAQGSDLPEHAFGAVLFADISGFTPLTDALARQFGPRRGADELTCRLNEVYNTIIREIERFGGSVIGFAGDAVTCWFAEEDRETGLRRELSRTGQGEGETGTQSPISSLHAVSAASAIQSAIRAIPVVKAGGMTIKFGIKTAVASGIVHRFVVGDPAVQLIDVLAGDTLERMAACEKVANEGELIVDQQTAEAIAALVEVREWRNNRSGDKVAVIDQAPPGIEPVEYKSSNDLTLNEAAVRSWVLPAVHQRLSSQQGHFLAELRPATSLFLRFGGLDFDADPDAGSKLDQFARGAQHVLSRVEAVLIQLSTGDKGNYFYAAFGAPIAHDDDPIRAIAAAIELQRMAEAFPFIDTVQIGISMGTARVGPYGSSGRQTYGVLSDEANIAARLMSRAEPGQILVSQQVVDAAQRDYQFQDLGKVQLKGKPIPQSLYAVIGRQVRIANHLEALFAETLVGRERELAIMSAALEQVLHGEGQILRIEGGPGLGKSHLVAAFLKQAEPKGISIVAASCQSTEQDIAYNAARQVARQLLRIDSQMTVDDVLVRLNGEMADINPELLLRLPLLGDLIGVPIPDNATTARFDAKLRQEALASLAVETVLAGARRTPVVMVSEDVHWMDEASQALLLALARVIGTAPILLLMVHRPGVERQGDKETRRQGEGVFEPEQQVLLEETPVLPDIFETTNPFLDELAQLANQVYVKLEELPPSGVIQMVMQRLGGSVSPLAISIIQAQAQGNPFFTEELIDALVESGRLRQSIEGAWALSDETITILQTANCLTQDGEEWQLLPDAPLSSVDLGVPNSIQGVVLSRLDRLPEAVKSTLKVASVIGRLFEFELLASARPLPLAPSPRKEGEGELADNRAELHIHLRQLLQRDFARLERPEPGLTYIFKHNITQEVAYNTLLEGQQRELHYAVGQALEIAQPEAIERLAFHFYSSDLSQPAAREKAIHYLDRAAQRAQRDYANETALSYLNRALQLDERRQWLKSKVEVLDILGRRDGQRAALEALTTLAGEDDFETSLLWGKYFEAISDYPQARVAVQRALKAAEERADAEGKARCLNQLGMVAWRQGEYEDAGDAYVASLSAIMVAGMTESDVEAEAHYGLGLVYRQQGKYEQALQALDRCRVINQELQSKQLEAKTINALGVIEDLRQNFDRAISLYEQALAIREIIGDRNGVGASLLDISKILEIQGHWDQAERMLQKAIVIHQSTGNRWLEVTIQNNLGALYLVLGNFKKARKSLEMGLEFSKKVGLNNARAYLLCNLGQVLRELGKYQQADAVLHESLYLAKMQAHIELEAICLNELAFSGFLQNQFERAIQQAQTSLTKFLTLGMELSTTSNLTLLAKAYLAIGKKVEAQTHSDKALNILDQCNGMGPDYPQRDYWACSQVYVALGEPIKVRHTLLAAYRSLINQAQHISDPAMRQSFLENISYHREILAEAKKYNLQK